MTDYCARCGRWYSLCRCAGDQVTASRRGESCNVGDEPHVIGRCDYYHEDVELLALRATVERVRGIVDRVAADPANKTDELWVYSIRNALDGEQPNDVKARARCGREPG